MILFFFNDTATTEIYTLSLHDALPISPETSSLPSSRAAAPPGAWKPKQATLEVWSSDDSALAQVLQDCLAENRIGVRVEGTAPGMLCLFVRPQEEAGAREIIREVVEGASPV